MYKAGATTLPVCPTCKSLDTKPASTAALEAPTAAPNTSANSSINLNFSALCNPRPPDTTILADPKSGRADLLNSCLTNSVPLKVKSLSNTSIEQASCVLVTASKAV